MSTEDGFTSFAVLSLRSSVPPSRARACSPTHFARRSFHAPSPTIFILTPPFLACALSVGIAFSATGMSSRGTAAEAETTTVAIAAAEGKFIVTADGQPFAEVDYTTYAKPIIYPIYGPQQIPMTRNFPMCAGVKGEATDHPHHKSLWFDTAT